MESQFLQSVLPAYPERTDLQRGFGNLDKEQQIPGRTGAEGHGLSDCPDGIDLTQANFSISIFARSILANCEQVRQIVYNNTGNKPVRSSDEPVEIHALNYTSGSGCLGNAIQRTINNGNVLNWENIAYNLQPACRTGIDYVDEVSSMPEEEGLGVEDYLVSPTSASPIAPMPTLPNVIYPTPRPGETWPYP